LGGYRILSQACDGRKFAQIELSRKLLARQGPEAPCFVKLTPFSDVVRWATPKYDPMTKAMARILCSAYQCAGIKLETISK
jgi:hypothetical protein